MTIKVTRWDIISGKRFHSNNCPVARAIRRATGSKAIVGFREVHTNKDSFTKGIPLPERAQEFISKFDRTKFFLAKFFFRPFTFELPI